jgi:hypothetical protein
MVNVWTAGLILVAMLGVASGAAAQTYSTSTSTGVPITPGTTDIGNHCDDCITTIPLPFPYTLYGIPFTTANVSSNGVLEFGSTSTAFDHQPLPDPRFTDSIFAYWDDLRTDVPPAPAGSGVFTSVSGVAPNRVFAIEWRTGYFGTAGTADFEILLPEGQNYFDVVYDGMTRTNTGTVGVQDLTTDFTQANFNGSGIPIVSGLDIRFSPGAAVTSPEPGTLSLLGTGVLIFSGVAWRRRRR